CAGEGSRSDLADLATLEWARAKVVEEADVEATPPERLRAIAGDELPQLRLDFVPALSVLRLQHDLGALCQALDDGAPAGPPLPRRETIAIWRKEFEVLHAPLDADEAQALA